METGQKLKLFFMAFSAVLSLIIILDFSLSGASIKEKVIGVNTTIESHNNAGGNSHFSFKIRTQNYAFTVSESFAHLIKNEDELNLSITPFFEEVNTVRLSSGESEIHSLRLISGLILPLLIIIALALGYKIGNRWNNIVFVFEVLAFADLVFLVR